MDTNPCTSKTPKRGAPIFFLFPKNLFAFYLSHCLTVFAWLKMNKLSRLLLQSRNQLSKKKLCTKDYVGDLLPVHALIFSAGISTARQNFDAKAKGSIGDRIFAPYNIYKGKAALSVSPILPKFIKLSSGNLVVDRHGVMLMSFVPAISEKKYDREKRQVFALSPTEIGSLISLGPTDSCEFFHDPSMLSSNAGQVRKSLSIKSHGNASGYFISLMVNNNILKTRESFSVPVTTAEFAVMKTACSFALPHIMGWDRLTTKMLLGTGGGTSTIDRRLPDSEWNR